MKIALIAPVMITVPPEKYGGIERDVYETAIGLAERGHQITIFCAGGSTISGHNIERVESSPYPTAEKDDNRLWEVRQVFSVLARQNEFDVINFHYEPLIFDLQNNDLKINVLDFFTTPVVLSFHNITSIPANIEYYKDNESLYRHTVTFVSKRQQEFVPFFPDSHVVYNGLPIKSFPFDEKKEDYFLFLGRITPEKGILEAITVAKNTHTPLIIVAKVDPRKKDFFEKEVMPHIDGKFIQFVGEKDFNGKVEYLKRAKCLLFTSTWEEPFGLVIVEALACGTPVIAFRKGAVPEIITHGVNGLIVSTVEEMAKEVEYISSIKPTDCRASVENRFDSKQMVDNFEKLFTKILMRK